MRARKEEWGCEGTGKGIRSLAASKGLKIGRPGIDDVCMGLRLSTHLGNRHRHYLPYLYLYILGPCFSWAEPRRILRSEHLDLKVRELID